MSTKEQKEGLRVYWLNRYGKCETLQQIIKASVQSARLAYYNRYNKMHKGKAMPVEPDYKFIRDNRNMSNSWLTEHMPHLPPTVVIDIARKIRREDGNA